MTKTMTRIAAKTKATTIAVQTTTTVRKTRRMRVATVITGTREAVTAEAAVAAWAQTAETVGSSKGTRTCVVAVISST